MALDLSNSSNLEQLALKGLMDNQSPPLSWCKLSLFGHRGNK